MKLSDIPSLLLVNGGKELRASALKLHNYAVVNGLGTGDMGKEVEAFWKDQMALLKVDTGLPSDGKFLGLGVPDIRMDCYKALSYVRMAVKRGDTDAGKSWETFCDFLATEAAKTGGGGEPPKDVVITVGKDKVFLAPKDHTYATNAMEVLNDQGGAKVNFMEATIPWSVSPAGTQVTFDFTGIPENVGHAGESEGAILFRAGTEAGKGVVKLKAGDKEVTIELNVVNKGLSTGKIADMTIGQVTSLDVTQFVTPYQDNAKNLRLMLKKSETVLSLSGGPIYDLKAEESGFQRVFGLCEWDDAPGIVYADRTGVNVADPDKAMAVRNNVLHNVEE